MSNVIKSYSIRYETESKMTIDYKERDEELQAKRISKLPQPKVLEGFEEGLKAVVVDTIASEEDLQTKASLIIEKANKEAADIIKTAKEEASKLKEDTKELAWKQGYENGMEKSNHEIQNIKKSLLEEQLDQKQEFQKMIQETSVQVTELMVSLISKLTGVIVEDKNDIILYLVDKSLRNIESTEDLSIRVSREDEDVLSSKKEYIEGIIGRDIQITVDPKLVKNQCLIETESKLIDCSLDVQLNNLITDLKLLSSI